MDRSNYLIWTGIALLAMGCFVSNRESVVGDYRANYGAADERLRLKDNGSFAQEILLKASGRRISTRGTWTFDSKESRIDFKDRFIIVSDGFGVPLSDPGRQRPGLVSLPVLRFWGRVEIEINEDVSYKKQAGFQSR